MDNKVFEDEPYTQRNAWEWMIGEAQWKDGICNVLGKPVFLKRGQFSDSIRFMAIKFKWSKSKVECFLNKLRTWSMIQTDNRTGQLIITICNYSRYQDRQDTKQDAGSTATGQEPDKQEEIQEIKEKIGAFPEATWEAFLAMRKKLKKPATPEAQVLILNKLSKFKSSGHDPKRVLENSIEGSWQGVFEPKSDQASFKQRNKMPSPAGG